MDVSDSKDLLRRFGLLKDGRPLNVAMALFGKDLTFYPHCILKMAWFKGKDKTIFLDNRMVSGNIIQLQSEAMAFCFKQLNLSGVVRGLYRKEELEMPAEAIAKKSGVSSRTIQRTIMSLVKAGVIKRVGPGKGGHWEVV